MSRPRVSQSRRCACGSLLALSLGLSACASAAPPAGPLPLPPPDHGTARRDQALARQQDAALASCPDAPTCTQAHFIRALLALSQEPRLSIKHFRSVVHLDPHGRLAASSRFWLALLDGEAGDPEPSSRAIAQLVRDLISRELLLQQLAKEAGVSSVEALRQELTARDRKIAELARQLDALKRVDREIKEKVRPLRDPRPVKPQLDHGTILETIP